MAPFQRSTKRFCCDGGALARLRESSARRGHAGRVKRGRAVHRCRRSAYRSRRCVGLCIVAVAVLSAAADAVLVAHQVHPAAIV